MLKNIPLIYLPREKRKLAREKNLKLHGFSYQKIFFAGFDKYGDPNYPLKSKIILQKMEKNSEIIFLDDLLMNCKEVLESISKARVFLLTKPYNKKEKLVTRVASWDEFQKQIES